MTGERWIENTAMSSPHGEAGGLHVKCGGTNGYAKPLNPHHDGCPRAAHEKIASDLAFELMLPIPPVVLWRREGVTGETHCSVSATPFWPAHRWAHIESTPTSAPAVARSISDQACAMSVFDTWVDNRDRHNNGNLLVTQHGGGYQAAYIDYAFSLSYGWGEAAAPTVPSAVARYPHNAGLDVASASRTLERIEGLSDEAIRAIVDRIPSEFLSDARKRTIAEGLSLRKNGLRPVIRAMYGSGVQ